MSFRIQLCFVTINFLLLSCNSNSKNAEVKGASFIAASETYQFDSSLFKTASIFYDSLQNKNSLKEVFIDKVYEDQLVLTFRAKPRIKNYFEKNKPSYIFYLQPDVPFYVYSGIEDVITGDLTNIKRTADQDTVSNYYLCMSFTVDKNKRFTLKSPCNIPFGINLNNSIQPEIDVNKYQPKAQ